MPRILTKKSRHCGIGHVEGIWYNSVSIAYILAYYRFSMFFDKRANKTMIQETHMNKGATCTDRERERESEKKNRPMIALQTQPPRNVTLFLGRAKAIAAPALQPLTPNPNIELEGKQVRTPHFQGVSG